MQVSSNNFIDSVLHVILYLNNYTNILFLNNRSTWSWILCFIHPFYGILHQYTLYIHKSWMMFQGVLYAWVDYYTASSFIRHSFSIIFVYFKMYCLMLWVLCDGRLDFVSLVKNWVNQFKRKNWYVNQRLYFAERFFPFFRLISTKFKSACMTLSLTKTIFSMYFLNLTSVNYFYLSNWLNVFVHFQMLPGSLLYLIVYIPQFHLLEILLTSASSFLTWLLRLPYWLQIVQQSQNEIQSFKCQNVNDYKQHSLCFIEHSFHYIFAIPYLFLPWHYTSTIPSK